MKGFLRLAGHLLGRALVAAGLSAPSGGGGPAPTPTGVRLPTHAKLLSPARHKARRLG